jgi:predicted RND superfamily exporter protein
VLVLVLFILAVRRLGAIFFVGIPLLCALVWTLGAASFFYERITVVTCAFGVAIVGLGIDYAIHLYNRYLEERVGGAGVQAAIETALCQTGQGVLVGGVTTAVGFYGLYFTGFEGFQELGIVGGTGIFCCLIAMLLVLPPLVVLSERVPDKLGLHRRPSRLGLRRLVNTIRSYPRLTLTVGLIITAYLGYYAQEVDFNEDIRNFRDPPAHYDDLVRRAENRFQLPATQLIAIVSAPTLEEALHRNDILYRKLEEASRLYPILAFDSLRPTLPSIQTQADTQTELKRILDLDAIENEVRSIANRLDLRTTVAIQLLDPLREWREAATEENRIRFGDESSPAFARLVQRHVATSSYRYYVVTSVYPRQGEWNRDEARDLAIFLYENVPSIELTGPTFVGNALKRLVKQGMVRAVLLVAAACSLLLILHFRSTRKTLVAVVPVFASMVWTLGTMRLLGIDLNFLNISVIPLILGLGIDDGLHILQRYYEGGRRDLSSAIEKTGRAVVLTSMTTMLAFGTLTFATFRGVRSIGIVAVLGVGYALIAALFLVPALLQMAGERLRWSDLLSEDEERRSHDEEFTEYLSDEEQSRSEKPPSKKT